MNEALGSHRRRYFGHKQRHVLCTDVMCSRWVVLAPDSDEARDGRWPDEGIAVTRIELIHGDGKQHVHEEGRHHQREEEEKDQA